MLEYFSKACEHVKKEQKYKVWQNGYHAEHIVINSYVKTRLHTQQSCKDRIVTLPEDYYYSSAGNYASLDNDLKVILLDSF
jgi:type 1 glutamine amidotransferase